MIGRDNLCRIRLCYKANLTSLLEPGSRGVSFNRKPDNEILCRAITFKKEHLLMVDLKKTIDRLYDFLDEDCAGEKVKSLDDYFFNALYSQFEKGDLSVNGVYFTGSEMAGRLIKFSGRNIDKPFVVYDPACGAGDLLESVIADWQVKKTLSETLNFWEDYI